MSKKKLLTTKTVVTLGLLIALSIILTRFLAIMPTPNIRISFGSLPIIIAGLLFGPIAGGLAGLAADFLGTTLFSSYGWFPPLALTPVIMGVVPPLIGMLLKKRTNLPTFIAMILPAEILGPMVWTTLSLQWLNHVPFLVNLPLRLPVSAGIAVVDILMIFLLYKSGVFRTFDSTLSRLSGGKNNGLRGDAEIHS
ncbi:ECF transporter S component, folate family [Sporobacter termitidis DSM 10068]|uniref:ECF transporter S component, folate family n=1 Tax=Sporobacter termitidis DSM 10068 TaxID=1123282 RepID=A0A1M5TRC3_9FIRM|nr:folate family ECF transporter S component [Sporobacter termitidis]SHH52943.1 ECF transporter S component, folate family [Sporobacter termitidis DSM 10068]